MNDTPRKRVSWGWWLAVSLLWGTILFIMYPVVEQRSSRGRVDGPTCANNLHQIGLAISDYMGDWDDRLPVLHTTKQRATKGEGWPDLLEPHVRTRGIFRCPKSWRDYPTYSYNSLASGLNAEREVASPSEVPLVFDSVNDSPENNNLNGDTVWRPSDGGVPRVGSLVIWPESQGFWGPKLPKWARSRHEGSANVLYVDGHVKTVDLGYKPQFDPRAQEE